MRNAESTYQLRRTGGAGVGYSLYALLSALLLFAHDLCSLARLARSSKNVVDGARVLNMLSGVGCVSTDWARVRVRAVVLGEGSEALDTEWEHTGREDAKAQDSGRRSEDARCEKRGWGVRVRVQAALGRPELSQMLDVGGRGRGASTGCSVRSTREGWETKRKKGGGGRAGRGS